MEHNRRSSPYHLRFKVSSSLDYQVPQAGLTGEVLCGSEVSARGLLKGQMTLKFSKDTFPGICHIFVSLPPPHFRQRAAQVDLRTTSRKILMIQDADRHFGDGIFGLGAILWPAREM